MDLQTLGRALLFIGSVLVLLGLVILIIARMGIASRLSDLPGTLRLEGPGITCVVPILASIVLSIILTIGLNLLLRWLNRP